MSATLKRENLKKFVTEIPSAINNLIEDNFKSSQRIKLMCYDVSNKYIAFGANNGSIHIYKRRPEAAFLKIIPSKGSSAIQQIEISPNEKHILVSDEAGLIIILENCFEENNFHNHIRSEHKGKTITAMKWHNDTKAYIGDDNGSVSVVSIPNLISLALMNTPYESLMDLDSPIVQIDCLSRFLLVTTERRAFICDTEREMYKQIGRQDKGKALGSCFFHTFDDEIAETIDNFENHNLYCARPGLRMWQANFEGEVNYTHNYRFAVANINEILLFNKDLTVENITKPEGQSLNFGNILLFDKKYLCAIDTKSIYIIDPEQNDLLFYYFSNRHIKVKLVDNEIFIWDTSGKIRVLQFYDIEDLIFNIHKFRHYKAGIQFIVQYKDDVLHWSKYSPHIKLVVGLKKQLDYLDTNLKHNFNEILLELLSYEQQQMIEYLKTDDPKIGNIDDVESSSSESEEEISNELQIMYKQYKLNETNDVVLMPAFTDMLLKLTENEMTELFLNFEKYMESMGEIFKKEWCYNQFLHHFRMRKGYTKLKELNSQSIDFLTKSFLEINRDATPACKCTFPLPNLNKTLPKYDLIGKVLSEHYPKTYLFGKIPHLWLHRITSLKTIQQIQANLPLILQFGYFEILKKVRREVTYDFCDTLVEMFVKLKTGKCLNCGETFPDECCKQIHNWEYVGLILIQYIGPDNVLKLFLNRHEDIPKDELSEKFYMACMFAKTRVNSQENGESQNHSVDLARNLLENNDTQSEVRLSI